jgi:hypothetical protein
MVVYVAADVDNPDSTATSLALLSDTLATTPTLVNKSK